MILVTGATGRAGKHLVATLLEKGEKVRVLVRTPEKARMLWGESVQIVQGDILDRSVLEEAAKGVDIVYHLAALVSYTAPREELFQVNVEGTRNVLEAAKGKRIIHLSTTAVYGKKAPSPITEQTPFAPTEAYGESKAEADKLARKAGALVLRPTVIYGPGFTSGFYRLFGMISKKRIFIAGPGNNRLQWTHIDDLVSALLLARKKGWPGQAYNIVSDDIVTQEELLGIMARMIDMPAPKRHISLKLTKILARFLGKNLSAYLATVTSDRAFDCSKAKKDFGWKPEVTFEQGLKEVAAEYLLRKASQG